MAAKQTLHPVEPNLSFSGELRKQRWDDHRFYHHTPINQSLHFLSPVSWP